ncbi:MAG: manganese efflux pump MntP family protein [Clostridium sp.]
MSLIELFILAVALSMDAFAVSVCKGLSMPKLNKKHAIIIGLYFGIFQALMPLIGYFLGSHFSSAITSVDHWLAFILLFVIGINMIKESMTAIEEEELNASVNVKTMLILAVATSIDALAVGITFAFLQVQLLPAVSLIGIITFILSVIGVKVGNVFGTRYKSKAECLGGIVLILIGFKILIEHLFF